MMDIISLLTPFQSGLACAGLLFFSTATLITLCVPGVIVPMAVTATALLGPSAAIPVVASGALIGSHILFLFVRRVDRGRVRAKFGPRLKQVETAFERYGLWSIVGLRVCGAPHYLVTSGSALLPVGAAAFAVATLAGFLPIIAAASVAGSLL